MVSTGTQWRTPFFWSNTGLPLDPGSRYRRGGKGGVNVYPSDSGSLHLTQCPNGGGGGGGVLVSVVVPGPEGTDEEVETWSVAIIKRK